MTKMASNAVSRDDFSKGSILSAIIRLAVPMTLAQFINVLYNIVDRIFIGRIDGGSSAITGLGICLPLITIVSAFSNLISSGGAPLFSIERGKGNSREAGYLLGNSFTMLIVLGLSLTVLGLIFKKPLLYALGAGADTFSYANEYITIYLLGSTFVMISLGLNSFINAQGAAKTGMMTVAIGAVLNVILDPILIFGLGWGIKGAAVATVIAQFCSAVWTLRYLTGKRAVIKLERGFLPCSAARIKRITGIGLSGFMMAVTNSIVQMVCNINLGIYGGDVYIGAMTIINSVREVISLPVMGFSNSAQPIMGFNYGAGQNGRVKEAIRLMSGMLIVYSLVMWFIVWKFPSFFVNIFSHDEELVHTAASSMKIYFFGFFLMAMQFSGQTVFTALGRAKQAIFFSVFRKVIIVTPLVFILPRFFGAEGVFLAEPVSNLIGGGACFITMLVTVYRKL